MSVEAPCIASRSEPHVRSATTPSTISLLQVVAAVAVYWNLTREELMGLSRKQHVAHPRFIAMAIAHDRCGLSAKALGRIFQRDHSSVLRGMRVLAGLRATDSTFDEQFREVERSLGIRSRSEGGRL